MPLFSRIVRLNQRGASLLEVLAATIILSIIVFALGSVVQKASIETNQMKLHVTAGESAHSHMEEIRHIPYFSVPVTPRDTQWFGDSKCDCGKVNFDAAHYPEGTSKYPDIFEKRLKIGGVDYRIRTCINRLTFDGGTWLSSCGEGPETDIKNIVIQTQWQSGPHQKTYRTESFISH